MMPVIAVTRNGKSAIVSTLAFNVALFIRVLNNGDRLKRYRFGLQLKN
jgi:hypothetical protein